jgi:hypothetical protein
MNCEFNFYFLLRKNSCCFFSNTKNTGTAPIGNAGIVLLPTFYSFYKQCPSAGNPV